MENEKKIEFIEEFMNILDENREKLLN